MRSKRRHGYSAVRIGSRKCLKVGISDSTWLQSRLDAEWTIKYRLGYTKDEKIGIKELHLKPSYKSLRDVSGPIPGGGITKVLLKSVPIGRELQYGREVLRRQTLDPKPKAPAKRRGRPSLPEEFYRRFKRDYLRLKKRGISNVDRVLAGKYKRSASSIRAMLTRRGLTRRKKRR